MAIYGPAPKPTALKLLEGNPGRRPLNEFEPIPRQIAPKCPEYIKADKVAYDTWRGYLPILKRMKVLTGADGLILANLCLAHSSLVLHLSKMREMNQQSKSGVAGAVIQTKTGYLALNQIYANVMTTMEQELKFCRELGLSPSARARLQIAGEKQGEDDGLLNGQWKPKRGA